MISKKSLKLSEEKSWRSKKRMQILCVFVAGFPLKNLLSVFSIHLKEFLVFDEKLSIEREKEIQSGDEEKVEN